MIIWWNSFEVKINKKQLEFSSQANGRSFSKKKKKKKLMEDNLQVHKIIEVKQRQSQRNLQPLNFKDNLQVHKICWFSR